MDALLLARCFVCAFFAIVMLQSGLDKLTDFKGNLSYLQEHFSKTIFKPSVAPMLASIAVLETLAGALCGVSIVLLLGHVQVHVLDALTLPGAALALICLDFCMLMLGQRIAKDYAGAASLAGYFVVALVGLFLMN